MHRKSMLSAILLLGASLFLAQNAFAGAWTVPQYKVWGEYYMKWDWGKQYIKPDGKREQLTLPKNARSWEFVMEPKMEFGVTNWLTALGSIEYKQGHYKEYGRNRARDGSTDFVRKNNGITNIKFGGRWRWVEKPVVFSVQGKYFMYPGYGNYHGDDNRYTNQPSIGKGDDAFELRALAGKTFSIPLWSELKLPCYVGAETGYRWRTRHVASDIPFFFEGGFWPVTGILIKSEIDGYKCVPGTGSIKESYGIWRIGGVWEVFGGDSILRKGNKLFNLEFQYGMTVWGKNTTAFQEWVVKVNTQF